MSSRWGKEIGQADHCIGAIGDGARNQRAALVGSDEGNIRIGQQRRQKETRLLGGRIVIGATSGAFPLRQFGLVLEANPLDALILRLVRTQDSV